MNCSNPRIGALLALLAAAPIAANAQTAPVRIDGLAEEWEHSPAHYTDSGGDGSSGANFRRLWSGSDAEYFFIACEFGVEVGLQSDNNLRLYLDADLNVATGQSFSGIGAELVWHFGNRSGTFRSGNVTNTVNHDDLGLVTAPTVTSEFFEIAFPLDIAPDGTTSLFRADSVRIVIADGTGGDRIPDTGQILTVPIDRSTPTRRGPVDLMRQGASDIRILTYNVEDNGLFSPGFTNQFSRILSGIGPDIMVFQEIRDFSAQQTADRVELLYPAGDGSTWFAAGSGTDIVMVSRYPITETIELQRANPHGLGNRVFRVDPGEAYPRDLLVVGAHLRCCQNDAQRQLEADEIMAFIRDGMLNGSIESQTPIITTGDLNLVGDRRQLITLVSGQIVSPMFLPSFPPDWDGSDFEDLIPGTTGAPFTYTWTGQGFSPGRLDYFIYSDAVISTGNAFALDTRRMSLAELQSAGLRMGDSSVSDHLPTVADFRFGTDTAIEDETPADSRSELIEALYPNPTTDRLQVRLQPGASGPVLIEISDVLGRVVSDSFETTGSVDGRVLTLPLELAQGIYMLRVRSGAKRDTALFVVASK